MSYCESRSLLAADASQHVRYRDSICDIRYSRLDMRHTRFEILPFSTTSAAVRPGVQLQRFAADARPGVDTRHELGPSRVAGDDRRAVERLCVRDVFDQTREQAGDAIVVEAGRAQVARRDDDRAPQCRSAARRTHERLSDRPLQSHLKATR